MFQDAVSNASYLRCQEVRTEDCRGKGREQSVPKAYWDTVVGLCFLSNLT